MAADHKQKLHSDIASAERLVSKVPLHECKTELQSLSLQSFMLLSHAALEHYFESLGTYAAKRSVQRFNSEGVITKSLLGLVSCKILEDLGDKGRKKIASEVAANIGTFAGEALTLYVQKAKSNHGIKKENLNNLLIPVGVEPELEDVGAFNALDVFGTHRGDIAHQFSAIRTEHTLSNVKTTLATIMLGVETYDAAVEAALS